MASTDYRVLTPERVSLEYGIAGIGSRGAAAIIDTLLQFAAIGVMLGADYAIVLVAEPAVGAGDAGRSLVILLTAVTVLFGFVVTLGYFMFFEITWSGQTPGKRLLGVRVIRESGYPIRPVDAVIRNVVRLLDWLPFFYGIGTLVMLFNARSKRVGDFASGTIVVREGSRAWLSVPPPPEVLPETRPVLLSSSDATLVRDFLVRRASMHPGARRDLGQRLAAAVAKRYHLSFDDSSDAERFLERLSP